ncbi:hypothetical protein DWA20_05005 [Acinetobacter baumannii]|uniref:hypothetical protein n=1 Tax=Acinetobacter baumannii TaxID=470 RepID=UPI000E092A39|nr:hypothetical protein [Acinetobacter baumannii]RDF52234.1 hypothetical protein DWA20_05005 [Acinetobacter baumannii]
MLIELYDQLRKNLIEINDFYLEQCQLKLLNQFDNISQEADEYEEKWRIEKESHYFNKDPYDSSSLYYDSYDASIIFYQNLSDLQQNVRFSVIAGMYHRWEKQFRSFLHNQSRWWGCTHHVRNEIWTLPVNKLFMLFKTDEFDIEKQEFFKDFDACRVIVNVFKHGNGSSYRELCNKYPFYLKENYHGMENNPLPYFIYEPTFNITDDDVVKFSKAISEFWRKLKNIENVEDREEWLRRTFEKRKRK